MKVIKGLKNIGLGRKRSVVTIGVFDGVHIGHRKIIEETVKLAGKEGLDSIVVTFDPHPSKVLKRRMASPSLISLKHRIKLIGRLGADYMVILNFTESFSRTPAEIFIKNVIFGKLAAKYLFIGKNFYFGKGADTGAGDIKKIGAGFGLIVKIINSVKTGGVTVSSSCIRSLIKSGSLREAETLLGRPVSMLGTVVQGAGLARYLGYPTANINPHHEVIPPIGVYAIRAAIGSRMYRGVLNIGVRPTFYGPKDREPSIEAHIFDFKGNLYGRDIEIYFIKKVRQEKKFDAISDLVEQISLDQKKSLSILRKNRFTKQSQCVNIAHIQ